MQWYYLVFMAAICNGLFLIVTKKALLKEHSIEFSCVHSFFVFLISLLLLFFADLSIGINQIALIYFSSSLFTMAFLFHMRAIRHLDISVVAPLATFGTAITAILAVLFLKELLTLFQVGGILLLLVGAYILRTKKIHRSIFGPLKKMFTSKYVVYLFSALLMFACSFLIIRFLTNASNPRHVDAVTYVLLLNIFVSFNFFVITTLFYKGFKTYKIGLKPWKLMILAALLVLAHRLFQLGAISMPTAKLAFVMAFGELQVLFAVVFGGRIFHEHSLRRKLFGTVVMLAGVFVIIFSGT